MSQQKQTKTQLWLYNKGINFDKLNFETSLSLDRVSQIKSSLKFLLAQYTIPGVIISSLLE